MSKHAKIINKNMILRRIHIYFDFRSFIVILKLAHGIKHLSQFDVHFVQSTGKKWNIRRVSRLKKYDWNLIILKWKRTGIFRFGSYEFVHTFLFDWTLWKKDCRSFDIIKWAKTQNQNNQKNAVWFTAHWTSDINSRFFFSLSLLRWHWWISHYRQTDRVFQVQRHIDFRWIQCLVVSPLLQSWLKETKKSE